MTDPVFYRGPLIGSLGEAVQPQDDHPLPPDFCIFASDS